MKDPKLCSEKYCMNKRRKGRKICATHDKKDHLPVTIEIVSGCANGADKLGEKWANSLQFPIKQFPADWNKFGKQAGYLRNKQMAEYGTHLVAFWDGKSKGTSMMIELAKQYKLPTRIIYYHL